MSGYPPAAERLAEQIEAWRQHLPDADMATLIEAACESAVVVLVDIIGDAERDDMDRLLANWLQACPPPSGVFGQSMANTMAYDATVRLRAAAAKRLATQGDERGGR